MKLIGEVLKAYPQQRPGEHQVLVPAHVARAGPHDRGPLPALARLLLEELHQRGRPAAAAAGLLLLVAWPEQLPAGPASSLLHLLRPLVTKHVYRGFGCHPVISC